MSPLHGSGYNVQIPLGIAANETQNAEVKREVSVEKVKRNLSVPKKQHYHRYRHGDSSSDTVPLKILGSSANLAEEAVEFDDFYWNRKFQEIDEKINYQDIIYEKHHYEQMRHLAQDFMYTATMYGKIIISEKFLPPEKKTIRPIDIGGIAGGHKYLVRGILFKFCIDVHKLYGDDEFASKVAGNELRALVYFQKFAKKVGIRSPLMCLIDFRGFRVLAMNLLPISSADGTFLHGSADGGNVVNFNPEVHEKMNILGKKMHLKSHLFQEKEFCFPVDMEIHKGLDGNLYACDFARIFPPQDPKILGKLHNSYLFRSFRPEFVMKYSKNLSSDAFCDWGYHNRALNDSEVTEATLYLHQKTIPILAAELDAENMKPEELTLHDVTETFHRHGVNLRYMGIVRNLLKSPAKKLALYHIIIARTLKSFWRSHMRYTMSKLQVPAIEPYRRATVGFLNIIFGERKESFEFWSAQLPPQLLLRFPKAVSEQEMTDLRNIAQFPALFPHLATLCGLAFQKNFVLESNPKPFYETDLLDMKEMVKQMPIVAYSSGISLLLRAYDRKADERTRLFTIARDNFSSVVKSFPAEDNCLCSYAYCLRIMQMTTQAEKYFKLAIDVEPENSWSRSQYAWFLFKNDRHDEAEEHWKIAIQDKTCYRALGDYGYFLFVVRKDNEKARKCFEMAIEADRKSVV